ncbi:MAG: hypothetical protein J6U71_02030 [Bacteroidales bacterium]|nr:hypothetical protein [Bacteroidales bacterium]
MSFEKDSQEFVMFQDFWNICKKYWVLDDTDEFWESVIEEVNLFCKKYGNEKFPRGMGLTLIDYLESQRKERLKVG